MGSRPLIPLGARLNTRRGLSGILAPMGRRTGSRGLAACLLAAAALAPGPARAQGTPQKAAAEALFRDARRLMAEGDLASACPKFVAAQRLDPTVGTALNVGECFERAGRTASAWTAFEEARRMARQAGDGPREAEGERRAQKLEPRLARLRLTARAPVPPGAAVKLDGEPLDAAVLGTAFPVDPGRHTVSVDDPAGAWTLVITIPARPVTVNATLGPPAAPSPASGPVAPPPPPFWGPQRVAGAAAGAAGVFGVVLGSIFGATAISKKNASNDGPCDATNHCDAEGKALRAEGLRAGNLSTAFFIGGGALLAGGVVLFATARTKPVSAAVGPTGVLFTGRF